MFHRLAKLPAPRQGPRNDARKAATFANLQLARFWTLLAVQVRALRQLARSVGRHHPTGYRVPAATPYPGGGEVQTRRQPTRTVGSFSPRCRNVGRHDPPATRWPPTRRVPAHPAPPPPRQAKVQVNGGN